MASSLLALLDDIATILDDVSVLTKVAAKKTAGVLGDDLALNAQQVTRRRRRARAAGGLGGGQGLVHQQGHPGAGGAGHQRLRALGGHAAADGRRRVPVLRGVRETRAQVPAQPLEDEAHDEELAQALLDPAIDMRVIEKDKIKGAMRTDFILSAEIIAITLGTVAQSEFIVQVGVLAGIAIVMTVGVYGLVAGIVKLDDFGLYLSRRGSAAARGIGAAILRAAPWLMKGLSVAGTAAMFLVGGGILVHGIAAAAPRDRALGPKAWAARVSSCRRCLTALVGVARRRRGAGRRHSRPASRAAQSDGVSDAAILQWTQAGEQRSARWRSEAGVAPPKRVQVVDDTLTADAAYRLASEGTGLLWRSDFHNARQLLQAMARRADRKPRKAASRPALARTRPSTCTGRRRGSARACWAGCWWRWTATTRSRCPAHPTCARPAPRPGARPTGSHPSPRCANCWAWWARTSGARRAWRSRRWALRPATGSILTTACSRRCAASTWTWWPPRRCPRSELAFDIGTGTGVLAAILARRGVAARGRDRPGPAGAGLRARKPRRAWACRTRSRWCKPTSFRRAGRRWSSAIRHGFRRGPARRWSTRSTTRTAGCCAAFSPGWPGTWRRAARAGSFFRTWPSTWACARREELPALIEASGLRVVARRKCARATPRPRDAGDPLHAARAKEVTSLWRLAAR